MQLYIVKVKVKAVVMISMLLCGFGAGEARGQAGSMFSDPKATNIGDALTVIIQESASATNRTSTSTDKNNDVQIESAIPGAGNVLDFIPLHALDSSSSSEFDGSGSTSRSVSLNARVTANVIGKKHNGDLLIEGVRTLKLNGETEAIYVSGSVSPAFIRANNTILSTSVGDLNIEYTGKGTITQGSRPGIFVRFVNWLL
jgi:flagellar L-ring protein precursor FlgH